MPRPVCPRNLFHLFALLGLTADTPAFGMLDDAESGVNPEALAHVVKELRRESAALQQAEIEAEANRSL